jgi:hypothetical protein
VRLDPVGLAVAVAAVALLISVPARSGDPLGTPRANEALQVCDRARAATDAAKRNRLATRGLALAEQAAREHDQDPKAHFAIFCNLGTQMRERGVSLRSLVEVRRLRREIDRTLELAPEWPDALLGKGSLLIDLPRMLGGDRDEGERLVRQALHIDPDFLSARLTLAHALADRGATNEARAEAKRAQALAEQRGDREAADEARRLAAP